MKFLRSLFPSALLLSASVVTAASSWNFDEAVISVISKKTGAGAGFKDKYALFPERIVRKEQLLVWIALANANIRINIGFPTRFLSPKM